MPVAVLELVVVVGEAANEELLDEEDELEDEDEDELEDEDEDEDEDDSEETLDAIGEATDEEVVVATPELEFGTPPTRWYILTVPDPPHNSVELLLQGMLHIHTPLLPGVPALGQDWPLTGTVPLLIVLPQKHCDPYSTPK